MATLVVKNGLLDTPGDFRIEHYPEAASQTFAKGDFVYLVSGKVTVAGDDPSSILGIAMEDSTGTTDTYLAVAVIDEQTRWSGQYTDNGTAEATVVTDVGSRKALLQVTAGVAAVATGGPVVPVWAIDKDSGASYYNDILIVESVDSRDTIGDAGGHYICKFDPRALQGAASITNLALPDETTYSKYVTLTIAQVNAGASSIVAAVQGKKIKMVDATAIAIGGNVGAVTTVDIKGTQSSSGVKLVAFAQAQLTQSTVLKPGITGAAVLADAASYGVCDANTAITVDITGSDATTATHIYFEFQYVLVDA